MIIDGNLLLDSAAAITASTNSTNVIDLANFRDLGVDGGEYAVPKVMCLVTTAFATSNGGTLQVSVQGSTDNSTWTTYVSTPAYAVGTLVAGARLADIDLPRPPAGVAIPRYLRLAYTVANAFTAGAVTSALVMQRQDQPVGPSGNASGYPSGFTVSN